MLYKERREKTLWHQLIHMHDFKSPLANLVGKWTDATAMAWLTQQTGSWSAMHHNLGGIWVPVMDSEPTSGAGVVIHPFNFLMKDAQIMKFSKVLEELLLELRWSNKMQVLRVDVVCYALPLRSPLWYRRIYSPSCWEGCCLISFIILPFLECAWQKESWYTQCHALIICKFASSNCLTVHLGQF